MKHKSFKFRFYPTSVQKALLNEFFGVARWAYNESIWLRKSCYYERNRSVSSNQVSKAITEVKQDSDFPWLKEAPATIITQSLADSDRAYKNFFAGRSKSPRYKKRGNAQSCRFQMDQRQKNFEYGEKFKLPKLGNLKLKWSQKFNGRPKMATVKRDIIGRYYVSFVTEEVILPLPKTGKEVGIDLGITSRVALSNGKIINAINQTNKYANQLKRAQRVLSRRQKGSGRWHQQRIRAARIHSKIANSRLDAIHKFTTNLVREFDVICMETLAVKNMVKNRKLAKSLHDASFGTIAQLLEYKADWYGKKLIKIDQRFASTQICSNCGTKNKMLLSERIYNCACGANLDRDTNAALNILAEGIRSLNAEGTSSDSVSKTQNQVGPVKRQSQPEHEIIDSCCKAGAGAS